MGMLNERYVCWDCQSTELLTGQEYFNDDTPECSSCEEDMEFFDSSELEMPSKPSFDDESKEDSEE